MPRIAIIAEDPLPLGAIAHAARDVDAAGVTMFRTAESALAEIARGNWGYDVAVVGQSRPGQFDAVTVDRLLGGSPLTRWVVRLGPWCRSERRRDGGLWPGAIAVTEEGFDEALRDALAGGAPPTATRIDRERDRSA